MFQVYYTAAERESPLPRSCREVAHTPSFAAVRPPSSGYLCPLNHSAMSRDFVDTSCLGTSWTVYVSRVRGHLAVGHESAGFAVAQVPCSFGRAQVTLDLVSLVIINT